MNMNRSKSTIMQLLNSGYTDVRFYFFNNFSDITENRRYQGYLFLGICTCTVDVTLSFFLYFRFLVGNFHLVFPLSILIWFAGRDIAVRTPEQRKLRFRRKMNTSSFIHLKPAPGAQYKEVIKNCFPKFYGAL
jgi:hypothetical protein